VRGSGQPRLGGGGRPGDPAGPPGPGDRGDGLLTRGTVQAARDAFERPGQPEFHHAARGQHAKADRAGGGPWGGEG
jgi:hypothetical protein